MIRNEKGFTLIELMVVVLIIGILVAVAIPVFGNAATNARDKACDANLRTLDGASAQYQAEFNAWPVTGEAGVTQLVTGGFLKRFRDEPHPNETSYTFDGSGNAVASGTHNPGY